MKISSFKDGRRKKDKQINAFILAVYVNYAAFTFAKPRVQNMFAFQAYSRRSRKTVPIHFLIGIKEMR